jgi:hypothetical protein
MGKCCDCELFMLAAVSDVQNGEHFRFCSVKKMNVGESEIGCTHFRSAYEGVFTDFKDKDCTHRL